MEKSGEPLVTVMMPSFNHGKYVRQAVESIFAESYRPLELVVVDDASSDGSPHILKELQNDSPIPFKLELSAENRGAPVALNRCLSLAEGEFIALCASDDMHFPGGMEKMVPVLLADEKVQVVYGNGRIMEDETLTDEEMMNEKSLAFLNDTPAGSLERLQTGDFPMWFQCGISRASMLREVGGWDEKLKADDGPRARRVYRHLAENGLRHAHVDVPYYIYRTHEKNMHKDAAKMREHILDTLESQYVESERPQVLVRQFVRLMRVCVENGNVKDAVQTLNHLLDNVGDPGFEAFLKPRLMTMLKDCIDAERDTGSGRWSSGEPAHEKVQRQKEKIEEQRGRIAAYRTRIDAQKEEVRGLKRSAAWRIGRMWTKPFRMFHPQRPTGDNGDSTGTTDSTTPTENI